MDKRTHWCCYRWNYVLKLRNAVVSCDWLLDTLGGGFVELYHDVLW